MSLPADAFEPAPRREAEAEAIARPSLTYWQDAWVRLRKNWLAMAGLVILVLLTVMALFGPYMVDYTYYEQNLETGKNLEPSGEHWFGTDDLGRDMFVRTWYGARVSLLIGVAAGLIDLIVGVLYGGISGYRGGANR